MILPGPCLQPPNSITTTPEPAAAVASRGRRRPSPPLSSRHKQTKQSKGKTPLPPHLPLLFLGAAKALLASTTRGLRVSGFRLPAAVVMVEMNGGVGVGAAAGGGGGGGGEAAAPRRWRLADELCDPRALETDYVRRFHRHEPRDHQCSSAVAKHIKAPVHLVWSLVRRFDQPQLFKPFVSRCEMKGNIEIGSVREVNVKSGLPATRSTERLELLDDNEHILSVRFVGGDHRLKNYYSILTVHPEVIDGRPGTLVIESFVVDVPEGNTKDETCYFVEALLKCNLKSLAEVSERLVVKDQTEPLDR